MPSSAEVRQRFLSFFQSKGHTVVASSPLVPGNDPSLLFTNAGMVQFKDVFLGGDRRSYKRAASAQRCVRAGGKHNDLDSVGYTARHHTFFEMLGNFSFGDYFKREAIAYAWELLTEVYGLAKDRLWVTVYHTDDEALSIWRDQIGVPAERIVRIGDNKGSAYASDNFWQMADTGPCGPCTEIFYDHGPDVAGGPPGSAEQDGDRYIEIWNLVFMQFDRSADGSLQPLPAPCVDTGMGLERLTAVLQQVHSNYEIDLFQHLVRAAAALTHTADLGDKSLRVIADHIRACAFLIVDGVVPSNEGRGYVLRRVIRRALRHGWKLGAKGPFFSRMVAPLVEEMGSAYPELAASQASVENTLRVEEERFAETLDQGMKVFAEVASRSRGVIAGDDAFRLYDTYGFPLDLTADVARERGLSVDSEGFEHAMEIQRERARAASSFGSALVLPAELVKAVPRTEFAGYQGGTVDDARVLGIVRDGQSVTELRSGQAGMVLLDRTPFYAESGGQVGDTGSLGNSQVRFRVDDTQKVAGSFHIHIGLLEQGFIRVGESVRAEIDTNRREAIVLNHSATHLLHAALRRVLGQHVQQKGSLVAPDRLRFDFSHFQPVTVDELRAVEDLVNTEIRSNRAAEVEQMAYPAAIAAGAMALFGEKYSEFVRVLRLGAFSIELCGGTHVARTGDIGLMKIVAESGVAAGVRRIEAVSGSAALAWVAAREQVLREIGALLGAPEREMVARVRAVFERQKQLERELETAKARATRATLADLAARSLTVGDIRVLAARIDGLDAKALREAADWTKQTIPDSVVVLASGGGGRVSLLAAVSGRAQQALHAGELLSHVASQLGGKGGGRFDLAQGGAEDSAKVVDALHSVADWVRQRVS